MKKISLIVSRNNLLTTYKTFVRPILDYADLLYDKPLTDAAHVITGEIKGTSCDLIYREPDLQSLAERRWFRKIFFFTK